MGKGDKKTRRGKINIGSYGARRRKKSARPKAVVKAAEPVAEVKEVIKKPATRKKAEAAPASETKTEKPRSRSKKKTEAPAGDLFTPTEEPKQD